MGYSKSSSEREVYSNKGLPQKKKKSLKQSNFIPQGTIKSRREQNQN